MTDRENTDEFNEAFGHTIRVLRAYQGLSRRQLAERADISYSYMSAIENGTKAPSGKILRLIADGLGTQPSELYEAAEARLHDDGAFRDLLERQDEQFIERRWEEALQAQTPQDRARPDIVAELQRTLDHLDADDLALVIALARRLVQRRTPG